jgi:hypothetical protein
LNLEIRDKVMKKEKEMYQKKTRKATLKWAKSRLAVTDEFIWTS